MSADSVEGGAGARPSPLVVMTSDGGATAFSERYGEHFHNRHGARTQARHVFIEASETHLHPHPCVLEIGFGLGANFQASVDACVTRGAALDYLAFEIEPQPRELLREVGASHPAAHLPVWELLLDTWPGNGESLVADGVRVSIVEADATESALPAAWASAIYLDGFSPATNPELWSDAFIARLAGALAPGGWLVTYSAAARVRRAMQSAGLAVERRPGVAGKRESLRARKISSSAVSSASTASAR